MENFMFCAMFRKKKLVHKYTNNIKSRPYMNAVKILAYHSVPIPPFACFDINLLGAII